MENYVELKKLRVSDGVYRDYVKEVIQNKSRLDSLNVLDCLGFREEGEDGFSLVIEGERHRGVLDDVVLDFLLERSIFDTEEFFCLNVAHELEVSFVFESQNMLYRPTVSSIAFNEDGHLLLVRKDGAENWHMPQGGVNKGERVYRALQREISEEIGVDKQFNLFPTSVCLRRRISFDRSWKKDVVDGVEVLWEGKQLHFYGVDMSGVSVSSMTLSEEDGLVDVGYFSIDSDEFATVSDYKKRIVVDLCESGIFS